MCRLFTPRACTHNLAAIWATFHRCRVQEQEQGIRTHQQKGGQLTSLHLQWEHSQTFLMEGETVRAPLTVLPRE